MANRIISSTDTSGNTSVIVNSDHSILIVGVGVDTTKEVIFNITSTTEAITHFGPSSVAVQLVNTLIKNGVSYIKGINIAEFGEAKPYATKELAYAGALAKTMTDEDIKCIILDCVDSTVTAVLNTHLTNAETAELARYGVVGVSAATITVAGATAIATALNGSRMFVAYPNVTDANNVVLDGTYTAAGIAAIIMTCTDDPALPVSGVGIKGFGGIATKLLDTEINTLITAGVTPLYPDNSVPTISRLVTTAQQVTNVDSVWHDGTTRFISDNVLESVKSVLKANYKRTKNVSRVISSIRTDIISVLTEKQGLEIIQNFDKANVSVIKDPSNNYGALVDYPIQVVTPLYTITITQHLKV